MGDSLTRLQEDNVIDNDQVKLKDELLKILPKTDDASIAVGYFFISGLSIIIHTLKDVEKVRLLISNTTDKTTSEALIEGFQSIKETNTDLARRSHITDDRKSTLISDSQNTMKKSLEHMSQTSNDRNVVEILLNMMKSKQLEVRVYAKEKLHAKAYIFQLKKEEAIHGMGIVGSSNLSIAGISHNSELNLKTTHTPDVNQLLDWFDDLWGDGLEFTDDFQIILGNSWAGKIYSPYEVFLKAAYQEYKDKLDGRHEIDPIWGTTFPTLFPFQKNAVDQGLSMFEQYGGVIIGDVVGLGKTYIGTALLKYLQLQEYRPLIICPPQLEPMWEEFCSSYEVDAKILSRGKLSQENFELFQDFRYKDRDLVLIDESHHFRNNNSRQYENLHQFMQARDAKAILLTATPFANKADDIKNQIMLFHQSPKTSIPPANETDMDKYFRQVKKGDADLIDFLRNIMVRRTRRYVINQWGKEDDDGRKYLQVGDKKKYFPNREMRTKRYDIDLVYQGNYERIVNQLDTKHLTFARYSLGLYVKPKYKNNELYKELKTSGIKLTALIRHLLLKRMESSLQAFKESIHRFINTHRIFLKLLGEGIVPIGDVSVKQMYEIASTNPDLIDEPETIEEFRKKCQAAGETKYKIDAFDMDKLISDIDNDLKTFEQIEGLLNKITPKTDDKLNRLQKLLDKDYVGKKVLLFTEFSTTARYLDKYLKWSGVKEQVDSATGNAIQCARRFDPDNNPSSDQRPKKSDEISLLLTTDVLSEGVNLQAGQVIINYDFHWNPIRLIQRAGRVDRIGSENEFIIVHNFLPDLKIEEDLGLEESVSHKIDEIQRVIGEDYKILKDDERINTEDIYAIYNEDESILDREDDNPLEPSKFEQILRNIQINNPEYWEEFKQIPDGIRSSGNNIGDGQLLMTCESGSDKSGRVRKHYLVNSKKKIIEINSRDALKLLESDDKAVYSTPSDYDELISIGWKKFLDDVEQIMARKGSNPKLGTSQKWIIEKLMKFVGMDEFLDERETIDTLHKAFSIPILKGKLNRELLKIKKSDMDNSELIKHLSALYIHYELQNQVKKQEEDTQSPRILYSKYVGK